MFENCVSISVTVCRVSRTQCHQLKDVSFSDVTQKKEPLLVLFYDGTDPSSFSSALTEVEAVEKSTSEDFEFLKCDISKSENMKEAVKMKMDSPPYVFVKTVDTGIEQVRMPLKRMYLSRYLSLVNVVPSYESAVSVKFKGELSTLVSSSTKSKPVFVMFYEPSCAHCFKANRVFEQGAGHFKGYVKFAKVDCSSSSSTRAICRDNDVTEVPTFVLFTPSTSVVYTGGWAVAEFELFFDEQKGKGIESTPSSSGSTQSSAVKKSAGSEAPRTVSVSVNADASVSTPTSVQGSAPGSDASSSALAERVLLLENRLNMLAARLSIVEDLLLQKSRSSSDVVDEEEDEI